MYHKMISEICKKNNINYKFVSKDWIIVLEKNGIEKVISGYKYSLNDHALGIVMDDKFALYELLNNNNLPIIDHNILFNPNSKYGKNTYKLAKDYFLNYNSDVVVKPNKGTTGSHVYHIKDEKELIEKMNTIFNKNFSLSICPYYQIDSEYRVVVLDNNIELVFEKIRPTVIGDGASTIKELLLKLNKDYFEKVNLDKYDYVLDSGKEFTYGWHFNLNKGATAKIVTDENLLNKLTDIAVNTTKKINARFVSVDIIRCKGDFYILEINSGVCINKVCNFIDNGYEIAKSIYEKAILKMFE